MSLSIDLDYRPMLGPIRDQGARPTCLSHAVSTAHEHARESTVQLSPEYLHHFASGVAEGAGISVADVSETLAKEGQPTESDCPYQADGVPCHWTPPVGVRLYRRTSLAKEPLATEVEAALKTGSAPILGISLPDAFHTPVAPWVIPPQGIVVGLHAVLVVGTAMSDGDRHYLIRNSWGPEWADGGYAWLDRSFLNQHLHEVLVLSEEPS